MAEFYKHDSKEACYQMAAFYDLAQQIKSMDGITKHWAQPCQDVDDVWYLQKPSGLECSTVACAFPNAVLVDSADITWPEPEGPVEP